MTNKRPTELREGETFTPGSYDVLHPGRFIKCGHLEGKPLTLTIKRFWGEHMGTKRDKKTGENKPDIKGVLSFVEIPEHYATQKTNERLLQAMFGPDPNSLPGKRVTFVPDKDKFGKDLVDAIRISGSPDISGPMTVVVTYPSRTGRPDKTFHLTVTRPNEATKQTQQQDKSPQTSAPVTAEPDPEHESQVNSTIARLEACQDLAGLDLLWDMVKASAADWPADSKRRVAVVEKTKRAALKGASE